MQIIRHHTFLVVVFTTTVLGHTAIAQSRVDTTEVEIAAARAMLAHRNPGNVTFTVDPRTGAGEHDVDMSARTTRPADRTAKIAAVLGGKVGALENVACDGCPLKGVAAHLILTAPQIDRATATVIATLIQNIKNARSPVYYETTRFTLSKTAHGWVVVREEQLGVS